MQPSPPTLPDFVTWEDVPSLVGSIRTRSMVARPASIEECREALAFCREHELTLCPRGSGRSYGDMALNDRQVLLDLARMKRILAFDETAGTIRVEAGTRLLEIYERVHHKNLTLAGSPTESHSSVAGAICANVNGKDAWRLGAFGDQVASLTLMTADGETHDLDPSHPWFPGVVGGMGLLGIVVQATLRLSPIPSPYVETTRTPARNVDELLAKMDAVERAAHHVVVWVDAYARGADLGRSVIHATRWLEREEPEAARQAAVAAGIEGLEKHRRFGLAVHAAFGPLLTLMLEAQRPFLRFFNWLYFTKSRWASRKAPDTSTELFMKFNFEASFTVPPAYLVCGPHGYTVQLTLPRSDAKAAITELLEICQASPCPPVTTILRAHRADENLISFAQDGYSLNFEIHPKRRHEKASRAVVDRLVDAVARRGGKIHLAKDQVLEPEQFRRLYPGHEALGLLKRELDPAGLLASDLARRVGACPPVGDVG